MLRTWQFKVLLAVAVATPSLVFRIAGVEVEPLTALFVFGAAVVACAFLLAWAAETAEADISASLAVAILALIAILPEYAIDLYFAYKSGSDPSYAHYAAANMTGSNRLLLGFGWPLVIIVFVLASRRAGKKINSLCLEARQRTELGFLGIAAGYAFIMPALRRISVIDAVVLVGLFVLYIRSSARHERGETEFVGVAAQLAVLPARRRRVVVSSLFVVAAVVVLAAAEPFADALVNTGRNFEIDEFLLVQWLAPLASEAPEFMVATIWALRGRGESAIGTLLSSKVNQWTLLVGSIPLAHLAGGGGWALELDARQTEEFILTAAQTILGFAILADLEFSWAEGALLLGLFALQFPFPETGPRLIFSAVYLVLAAIIIIRKRRGVWAMTCGAISQAKGSPSASGEED